MASPGYKPDVLNYALYEEPRDVLLCHPHGCAALMHGSIVWNLALASVSDDAVFMVLSPDVFSEGSFLSLADGYLWDNALSEADLEVFVVYTRCTQVGGHESWRKKTYSNPSLLSGQATQSADMSWWPKSNCLA